MTNTGIITWDDLNDTGHGTHVAGVIAAQNDNGGIGSIAAARPTTGCKDHVVPDLRGQCRRKLHVVGQGHQVCGRQRRGYPAVQLGLHLGNGQQLRVGTPGYADEEQWETLAPLEKDALDYFTHNAGSPNGPIDGGIAVFASGNEYANSAGFPGAASMCVSVAATAADFTPATYTNYGPGTTIAAPGGDQDYYYEYFDDNHKRGEIGCVLSTLPYDISETGYGYMEGTSMACPPRFGRRRARALVRRTAPPPLHGRRIQGAALRNDDPDRRPHEGLQAVLPLRL